MNYLTPKEVAEFAAEAAERKARLSTVNLILLGILAGAFIGFGAEGSTLAAHDIASFGVARWVSGILFSTGLILVILAGAELFTGNTLMVLGVYQGRITWGQMLRAWVWVYLANLAGSLMLAYFMRQAGLWGLNHGLVGASAVNIAYAKGVMPFTQVFFRGIMANWLVCLAIWLAYAAKDVAGKILGIVFPITMFVLSAYEHSVANMYYIPAGILAKADPVVAAATRLSPEQMAALNWGAFLHNLIPATLGNIIGGSLLVATVYWFTYLRPQPAANGGR